MYIYLTELAVYFLKKYKFKILESVYQSINQSMNPI